jgi:hypothetical protein
MSDKRDRGKAVIHRRSALMSLRQKTTCVEACAAFEPDEPLEFFSDMARDIALGNAPCSDCTAAACPITVDQILEAVNNALNGCAALIESVTATYAANCGVPTDVSSVFGSCLGQPVCSITFTAPDPAFGCAKELDVSYICGGDPALQHVHVQPEALHKLVTLSCS